MSDLEERFKGIEKIFDVIPDGPWEPWEGHKLLILDSHNDVICKAEDEDISDVLCEFPKVLELLMEYRAENAKLRGALQECKNCFQGFYDDPQNPGHTKFGAMVYLDVIKQLGIEPKGE